MKLVLAIVNRQSTKAEIVINLKTTPAGRAGKVIE